MHWALLCCSVGNAGLSTWLQLKDPSVVSFQSFWSPEFSEKCSLASTWGMQALCTSPFNINEEIGLSVLSPHICSPPRKTIPQALGSEHTNRLFKWNHYRSINLILQLITSNIWKERSYCVSALPPHRWAAGIKHIRKWNVCKSLKRRSWPKLCFKAFKQQENLDEM